MMGSILSSCGNLVRRAKQHFKQWTKLVTAALLTSELTSARAGTARERRSQARTFAKKPPDPNARTGSLRGQPLSEG